MRLKQGYWEASAGEGKYEVRITARTMEDSISCELTGGTKPHAGCVALALPGREPETLQAPGHRDAALAGTLSKKLCEAVGCPVSMSAGIHIDNANKADIALLSNNACAAVELLISRLLEQVV